MVSLLFENTKKKKKISLAPLARIYYFVFPMLWFAGLYKFLYYALCIDNNYRECAHNNAQQNSFDDLTRYRGYITVSKLHIPYAFVVKSIRYEMIQCKNSTLAWLMVCAR